MNPETGADPGSDGHDGGERARTALPASAGMGCSRYDRAATAAPSNPGFGWVMTCTTMRSM